MVVFDISVVVDVVGLAVVVVVGGCVVLVGAETYVESVQLFETQISLGLHLSAIGGICN